MENWLAPSFRIYEKDPPLIMAEDLFQYVINERMS